VRVGIVTHYWPPHRGGVEVEAFEQAHGLADRGHDVIVVSSAVPGTPRQLVDRREHGSLTVELHGVWNWLESHGIPWPVPSARLRRAWRNLPSRCDVVIVHGSTYAHSPLVLSAARSAKVPILLIQSNPHVEYPWGVDHLERVVDRTLGARCLHGATRVVSISRHTARHVARIAPRAPGQGVLYLGVDERRWRPPTPESREAARARLRLVDPVIVTVRRLVRRNGVDLAIRAWAESMLDSVGELVVVGDGPERGRLEGLARGHRVRFLGPVDDNTLLDVYAAADAFVLPTRTGEGFGLAAAEAMACGLPVVTTTGGAQEELVVDGVTGAVVDVDDIPGLGRAMRRYLSDAPVRLEAGAAGRQRVEQHFTWRRSVDELAAILMEMTDAYSTA
jgi:glycosyltransferase involved in cell wall biosynthesis